IINVSSIQSRLAGGMAPAYIAAKGAIDSLTYDLATLYGPSGVRVVAINPGAIDTEMSNDYQDPTGQNVARESRDFSCDMIPLRRWGSAVEIARTIVMLAGDDASYITGTTITVDGGWSHQIGPYRLKKMMFPEEFA
ncbi:MAG: SDR family oxidoreductase, partial [Planctomycetota bacterium]|nr:SDR family oxidoreductase [Planctomycetota bacterium]